MRKLKMKATVIKLLFFCLCKWYTNLPPAYTFVGDIEPFYCETLTFIDNLRKAGVEAKTDVYQNCFLGFDMLLPFKKISKKAIVKFEQEYLSACEKYSAEQKE